jgi:hypothetical protein
VRRSLIALAVGLAIGLSVGPIIRHFSPPPPKTAAKDWTGGWANRSALAALSRISSPKVVLLGDSQFGTASWSDLTGCVGLSNWGVPGAAARELRESAAEVAKRHPPLVIIEAGINDLIQGHAPADAEADIEALAASLKPARVLVLSVLPVSSAAPDLARRVGILNATLQARFGPAFVDAGPSLAGQDGYLRPDLTTDGLHVTSAGYAALRDLLAPAIDRACR